MGAEGFWTAQIRLNGELLPVTRPAKLAGANGAGATPALSASIWMMPVPIQPHQASRFGLEGLTNYMEAKPHAFYCATGTQLAQGKPIAAGDDIVYNGETYKVLTAIPFRGAGVTQCQICTATLHKVGS